MTRKPNCEALEKRLAELEQRCIDQDRYIQRLKSLNSNLTSLIENSDHYIMRADHKGTPLIFNSAYALAVEEFFGIEMKPGLKPHELLPEPERSRWADFHRRVLSGEKFVAEYSVVLPDGLKHYFEILFNPIMRDDEVVGFSESARDITAQKNAEDALKQAKEELECRIRERTAELEATNGRLKASIRDYEQIAEALRNSEDRYRRVSELTTDLSYSFRVEAGGKITRDWVAGALTQITGYSLDELETLGGWGKIIYSDDVAVVRFQRDELLAGRPVMVEYRIVSKGGEARWMADYGKPQMDEKSRQVTHIFGAIKDITEKKRAESERALLSAAIENAGDVVMILDRAARITYVNSSFERISGYTKSEIYGEHLSIFQSEKFGPGYCRELWGVIANGGIWQDRVSAVMKDGSVRELQCLIAPIRDSDLNIPNFVCVNRDVTDENVLKARLRQAQKMEELGTLAGGVAHDLNNILSGLVGYPELVLLDLPEDSPLKETVKAIQKSGKKAAAIVQDLLTIARQGVADRERVDLNSIVEEYLSSPEHMQILANCQTIEVSTILEDNLSPISGSPVHLSKTVMNLVFNAVEAMPDGGRLSISTQNRLFRQPVDGYETIPPGRYVEVAISDTGVGMPAEDLNRIFEPFYTRKVMGKSGTGLGMVLVWGTVKDHGGFIDIQSLESEGSRVSLFFPVAVEDAVSAESEPDIDDFRGNGETVLIVDDMAEQRKIAARILERIGYRVETAASGEAALEFVESQPVDILILDMIMEPGIDGLETYRRMLDINSKQRAVIASGYAETDRVQEALTLGVGAYVLKPYTLEEIARVIRQELDR